MRALRLAYYWLTWRVLDLLHVPQPEEKTMKLPEETKCPNCGTLAAEFVCHTCKTPRPGMCAEACGPEDYHDDEAEGPDDEDDYDDGEEGYSSRWDEDEYLDDPRHGQAEGINRDNRGRS